MNLIIVESPTKANTIKKFLGAGYSVLSSFGHIRDLPKDELGVDVKNNFSPKYIIPLKARKTVGILKKELEKSKEIILATDEDREGEAIAWHLSQIFNLANPRRIVFHEITKQAIQDALKNPRDIDMNLVDSQQARRILDRLVGYKLSPFLWKKVAKGLSAGRVQSVAVKLVAEREREIEKFIPQEYWNINALFEKIPNSKPTKFEALLVKKNGVIIPKLGIKIKEETEKIIEDLENAEYIVEKIEKKETKRNPLPPFTTSSLQQEAWQRFRFSSKMTMQIAQQLYEKGFITYHRTDSLNLSQQSLFSAKKFIEENFGKEYWAGFFRKYKAKGKVQEAHEAIRPSQPDLIPQEISGKTIFENKSQSRLYDLIWQRFMACQMAQAIFDSTTIDILAKNYTFRATGQILKFDGFLKIYPMKFEEKEIPELKEKEILELIKLIPSQHFTQSPPRYNEASLIKALEENGIGRPSTYAPILSTIQERNYIDKDEQKRFYPTEIGLMVNDLLVEHFAKIVNTGFTAKMEEKLDEVAAGKENWIKVCQDFYGPFEENLQKKYQQISKEDIAQKTLPAGKETIEKKCPKCGSILVVRLSRFGQFYACSTFPKCRHTESLEKKTLGIKCPKCQKGEIIEKRTKRRKIFYSCNQFPKCDFALWDKPINEKCPKCGSLLVETKKKQIKCSDKACESNQKVAE